MTYAMLDRRFTLFHVEMAGHRDSLTLNIIARDYAEAERITLKHGVGLYAIHSIELYDIPVLSPFDTQWMLRHDEGTYAANNTTTTAPDA